MLRSSAAVDDSRIQGELQLQLMHAVWFSGSGTVEEIRRALPEPYRGAYNTVQTVLNRLAERGLLEKVKHGNACCYSAAITEAEYVGQSLRATLAGASAEARDAALAALLGELDTTELSELKKRARRLEKRRLDKQARV